ncbi:trypsin-like peptidase domain-containing protein [Streptomyces sp. NPDC001262]|uniref:trypsin-like peptidase domain-containing protein n=1 Tax=Streptomyces sp. NPDC001262 TaxID=3364552 RepID=UPI00367C7B29
MAIRAGDPHAPAVWLVDGSATFLGSGFYVGPGLVVTCAHVVHDRWPVTVHGALGAEEALSATLSPPRPAGPEKYYPAPDLAVLCTPARGGRPVAVLATEEAPLGTQLSAYGFTTATASPGVQPDSALLTVEGPSGTFVRLANGWIHKGLSGSMLLEPGSGHVVGVVKATEDDDAPVGGWMIPLGQLRGVVDIPPAPPSTPSRLVGGRRQWVERLYQIPELDGEQARHALVRWINEKLPVERGIRPRGDSHALLHLNEIVGACLDNLDPCAALGALVEAVRQLAGGHQAVAELTVLLNRSCGGGADDTA